MKRKWKMGGRARDAEDGVRPKHVEHGPACVKTQKEGSCKPEMVWSPRRDPLSPDEGV